jgi:6-phosphogluconate dehydrogenase
MKIGFIGLGKMGGNMVQRLLLDKHEVVVFDFNTSIVKDLEKKGAIAATDIEDMIQKLPDTKVVWLMVPAGKPVDDTITKLLPLLQKGDILIDGGNSFWKDSQARAQRTAFKSVEFVDCGTSGGIWGLQNGYCLMYGGNKQTCDSLEPIFKSLATDNGYLYCGESGAGHFVKMVHNGIEYGMMQAFAEGFELMEKSPFTPDLEKVAELWRHGSVVRSWLLDLIKNALDEDPKLETITDYVDDNGEARWMVQSAMDFEVPVHVTAASLFTRFESRQNESFAMKMLAAMRNQFGGHAVKTK